MSRYLAFIIIAITLFLGGCSTKNVTLVESSGESFPGEDLLTLEALMYQQNAHYEEAIKTYEELFNKSQNIAFLKEALKLSFVPKQETNSERLLAKALAVSPKDPDLIRMKVGILLQKKELDDAKNLMIELLKRDKSSRNLTILGSIYFYQNQYDLALKYYDSVYKQENDEASLLKIVELLYTHLSRKDEAISYLETHSRMQGCTQAVCFKLIQIYGKEKNIDGLVSTYKMLYKRFNQEEYAKKAVELLLYKKDKEGAIRFLESTGYNQQMLMDIYAASATFDEAFKVAQKLYEETDDMEYLGRMAIYEYEMNKEKLTPVILASISKKFDTVIERMQLPLYLNYYGYLLIDHDLDIKKGIMLVRLALEKEPDSPYYIDSLAWGLFKLGKCKEALFVIEKIMTDMNEKEVLDHYEKIKQCIGN